MKFTVDIQDEFADRKVWSFLFDSLTAVTVYNVTVSTGTRTYTTTYKTLPESGDTSNPIKAIIGGDTGLNVQGRSLFRLAAAENADVLIVGGDIAYDNAVPSCYYTWDQFY